MQITSSGFSTGAYVRTTAAQTIPGPSVDVSSTGGGVSKEIDFSRITPRQLQAFLDDRLMNGNIDGPDGLYCSTLGGAIPGEWYTERPDVPVDLTSTIESMGQFARGHGSSKLVGLYDGLIEWMKMMEIQSAHISVVA